ncbi:MAG: DUF5671 domain-containing protein [bacterium]
MEQSSSNNQSSKFTLFYTLSLVALAFMAVSTGLIIFQIINKHIVDALASYRTCYSPEALKFAISAIIISTPIYYVLVWQIYKGLFLGILDKEASCRTKLNYVILFISSIVIIGYLIGIVYNFLDGELTVKFILKALTALIISAGVLSYYIYEIKRKEVVGKKSKVIKIYFFVSLVAVISTLISGFIFVELPKDNRARRKDEQLLNDINNVNFAVEEFYKIKKRLPVDFKELVKENIQIMQNLSNFEEEGNIIYEFEEKNKYRFCAVFLTSNKSAQNDCFGGGYWEQEWGHDKGYQCFEKSVIPTDEIIMPKPVPIN